MNYFLFLLYLAAACLIVTRIPFVKKAGLSTKTILILFIVRLAAGIIAVWLPAYFSLPNDYWSLHRESLIEYDILLNKPKLFFLDIFQSNYSNEYGGFFSTTNSFWNDLRTTLVIKILAICNIFSRGFIYTNTLFFNILGILGPVAFYRIFKDMFPDKKSAVLIGSFLLPSTLFFSSAMHKDLIVFTFLGLFFYALYFIIREKASYKKSFILVSSLVILLLMRNFLFIALIPALLSLTISNKFSKSTPLKSFIFVYSSMLVILLLISFFFPSIQPLAIISNRQHDFMHLDKAASQLTVNNLEPTIGSFLSNLPQALNHGFLKPYLWDKGGKFTPYWAIELFIYIIIFIMALFRGNIKILFRNHFLLFCIFFCFTIFLLIGYIVPNSSSIVRYKSTYLPLIITPLLAAINGFKRIT